MTARWCTVRRTCACGSVALWTAQTADPSAYRLDVADRDRPGRGPYRCDGHTKQYDLHDGVVLV